jgi:hypothetical protein
MLPTGALSCDIDIFRIGGVRLKLWNFVEA